MECKQSAKYLAGDKWNLRYFKALSIEDLWTWAKSDGIVYNGDDYLVLYKCVNFKRELCFELGKCMWRKHHSVFQEHLKYICDDIVKLFRVGILCYAERVQDMHDL